MSRKVSHDVLVHVRLRNRAERYEDVDVVSIAGRGRRGHDAVCFLMFFCAYFLKGFLDTCFLETSSSSSPKTLPPPLANTTLPRTTHTHTHYVAGRWRRRRRRSNARKKRGGQKALPGTPPRARDSLPAMRKRWTRLWSKSGRYSRFEQNATDEKEIQKRIRDGEEARDFFDDERVARKDERERNFETSLKSADPDKETWEVPKEAK